MKQIIILFGFIFLVGCNSNEKNPVIQKKLDAYFENSSNVTVISNNIEWYTDLDSALSVAQKDQKPLFLAFQSSTCQYCQQMNSETYTDVNVQDKLNSNYIPVIIDGDNHPELCSKYQVVSYPTFVILNSNGDVNKTIIGFQSVNDLLSKI